MDTPETKPSRRDKLLPHLIYLVIAFWITSKAWISGDSILSGGDQPDWNGTAWAYWWMGKAVTEGMNPFNGSWNFFPVGQRPLAQYNLLDAFLAWPFLKMFGIRVGYNFFATLIAYSTAWGMHILARSAGAMLWPAIYAGVALETSSFLLVELGHGRLSQAMLFFWLVGMAGLVRIARGEGSYKIALGTGLCLSATCLTYWYWGLFWVFAAIPIWLSEFWFWDKRRWLHLLVVAALTALICMPYVYALILTYESLPGVNRALEPWMDYGSLGRNDFGLAMGIKQSHWPLWPLAHIDADPDDKRIALVPLFLGIAACFREIPEKKRWISMMLIGYILTLGPYLKLIDPQPLRVALPYLFLYDYFPFFQRFWWPQRLELLVLIGLLVTGSLLLNRWTIFLHRWGKIFVGLAIVGIFFDIPWRNPYAPVEAHPPRDYQSRLYADIKGPIITTPVLSNNEITRHILWMQSFHEQPILGGLGDHIEAHRPVGYEEYINERVVLRALSEISQGTFQDALIMPEDVNQILEDGFEWIVIDPAAYSPGLEERWAAAFTSLCQSVWGTPTVEAGLAKAWKITPIAHSIIVDNIPPVEHSGPRTEEGFKAPDEPPTPGSNNFEVPAPNTEPATRVPVPGNGNESPPVQPQ